MRISGVRKISALFGAGSLFFIVGLMAAGCAGTAVTETAAPEQQVSEAPAPAAGEEKTADTAKYKDDDIILKFKDEDVDYVTVKKWWAYYTGESDPEKFETLPDVGKEQLVKQIGYIHLCAKKARLDNLQTDNFFKAKYFDLLSRKMPDLYFKHVIEKEVNPTDAEILATVPPALPEVQVRVIMKRDPAAARELYQKIKNGEDMEKLVRSDSEGLSIGNGGLSKWISVNDKEQYPPPVVEKYLNAEIGQVFEPFFQDIGHLIVRVEGKHSVEDVQNLWLDQNRQRVIREQRERKYAERLSDLDARMAEIGITILDEEKITSIADGKYPPLEETLIKIDDMEFNLDILLDERMKQNRQHSDQVVAKHIVSFVERALITQEALGIGLELPEDMKMEIFIESELVLSDLMKRKYLRAASDAPVTDEDVRAYYDANPKQFTEPSLYCLRLIQSKTQEDSAAALNRIASGEDFAAVATALTIGSNPEGGGDIGCFHEDDIPKVIFGSVEALSVGAHTAEPVKVGLKDGSDNWLLVQLYKAEKDPLIPFDSVKRPTIEGRIKVSRRAGALDMLIKDLIQEFRYENCLVNPTSDIKEN